MPAPHVVLQSVVEGLKQSGRLPDNTSYSTWELDETGGQSNVRLPVIEVTPIDVIRSSPHNTDFVSYSTNDSGEEIGYIFHAQFEMPVQIDVWTAEGDRYDPREIGEKIRYALYKYDDKQLGRDLPHPEKTSQAIGGLERFVLDDGSIQNDLSMHPALRRWRQTAMIWFYEEIDTAEEYGEETPISTVKTGSGDIIASDTPSQVESVSVDSVTENGIILFDATPNTESYADQFA